MVSIQGFRFTNPFQILGIKVQPSINYGHYTPNSALPVDYALNWITGVHYEAIPCYDDKWCIMEVDDTGIGGSFEL